MIRLNSKVGGLGSGWQIPFYPNSRNKKVVVWSLPRCGRRFKLSRALNLMSLGLSTGVFSFHKYWLPAFCVLGEGKGMAPNILCSGPIQ